MKSLVLQVLVLALFLAGGVAVADVVTWTGGKNGLGYQWLADCWDTEALPEADDTVRFVDIPIFKSRFEVNKEQSITLLENQEIDCLAFTNLYGISVQGGGRKLTLNSVRAEEVVVTEEDTARTATNKIAVTDLQLKGVMSEIHVASNHVVLLQANLRKTEEGTSVTMTGDGTLIHSGTSWEPTGTTWIQGGTLVRTGTGYPAICGSLIVGGAGKDATIVFGENTHASFKVLTSCDFEVRTGGVVRITNPLLDNSLNFECFSIDHGAFMGDHATISIVNPGTTDRADSFRLKAARLEDVMINWGWERDFTILPAEFPTYIKGTLNATASRLVDVPDGAAAVDFVLDGAWGGGNRNFGKTGAGTMLFVDRDPSDLYGIGRDFKIEQGTFILQSETEIGLGTNNIVVSAGATLGGTGHHVGGFDAANAIRGERGNITLNGAEGTPAILAPGTANYETGAYVPGTFTIGSAAQTNNVTFTTCGQVKIGFTEETGSKLVVNGLLTLCDPCELALFGPEDPTKLPEGEHVIVSTTKPMPRAFTSVTYNGWPLLRSVGRVTQTDNAVTFVVPKRGFRIFVR